MGKNSCGEVWGWTLVGAMLMICIVFYNVELQLYKSGSSKANRRVVSSYITNSIPTESHPFPCILYEQNYWQQ